MSEIELFRKQMSEDQRKACDEFDKGRFNDILYAYVVLALHEAGIGREDAEDVMDCLGGNLDYYPADLAMLKHRKLLQGEE